MATGQNGNGAAEHPFAIGVDPALSAQVRKELLDTLQSRAHLDPAMVERELNSRDVHAEFLRQLGDLGLVPDNLPDLLAGHLIAMWTVVHDTTLPGRDVATALSRQLLTLIAASPQAADPAQRQLMGEALMYETVLTLEAQQAARASGDKAKLKEMAESAQRNLLNQRGINLRKTRLTASGMARA
ncbi:DUF6683 family protein [Dokdonella sp.]|uniref:DUF6683 family protein n=1 Tax=Dokdonella sp. TaxID=2291710 RepID=UPI001B077ABB|nr:DUF6683 family protein [Dokdonella sp.]MBO9664254.1 hypothetical protein [Dokdonella sp.]